MTGVLTKQLVSEVAATCNVPTGDPVLDGYFDRYGSDSARTDSPVYYRFLYQLSNRVPGLEMIELGSRLGAASLHFLKGGGASAIGIDSADRHTPEEFAGYKFKAFEGDATVDAFAQAFGQFDIVFIDTQHGYEETIKEFDLWKPHVADRRGVLMFDDICAREYGSTKFWNELKGDKLTLPELHPEGWGVGFWFSV